MIIAKEKKQKNIAEYILYMWQIEDMLRAVNFDMDKVKKNIITNFNQPPHVLKEIENWYAGLIDLMAIEGVKTAGHLTFVDNIVKELNELHILLLNSLEEQKYQQLFQKAFSNIKALEKKSAQTPKNDIETCFNGLYGILTLRLKKKLIYPETADAMQTIVQLIAVLTQKYHETPKEL